MTLFPLEAPARTPVKNPLARLAAATHRNVWNFSVTRRGGLTFVKLGRFGFSFWVSRKVPKTFKWDGAMPRLPLDFRHLNIEE